MTIKLLGSDTITNTWAITANYIVGTKFTANATGNATELKIQSNGSGNIKCAIYSDNAGSCGLVLNQIGSTALSLGVNTVSIASTSIISGTVYWIAINTDTNNLMVGNASSGTTGYASLAFANAFTDSPSLAPYTATIGISAWGAEPGTLFIPKVICY